MFVVIDIPWTEDIHHFSDSYLALVSSSESMSSDSSSSSDKYNESVRIFYVSLPK